MSEQRTLLLPSDISARKYVDGKFSTGVRGMTEDSLRIVRGRVDTTAPTILQGSGFTVAKNGTGDITVTFTTAFSAIPVCVATPGESTAASLVAQHAAAPTVSTVRLIRDIPGGGVGDDGILNFIAVGPA